MNLWQKTRIPILALAPMASFTDSAFRKLCRKSGADLVYTEMVSSQGVAYKSKKTLEMLNFSKAERPVILQLFGKDPEKFKQALEIIKTLPKKNQPDGIDINFGCPARKVVKNQGGVALMKNLDLCYKIIKTCTDNSSWPVSIKIRAGIKCSGKQTTALDFLKKIKNLEVKAVMIHARTYEQGFIGEPDWEIVKKARKLFKGLLLANGSIDSAKKAKQVLKLTQADGIGIGRAAIGRPWVFEEIKHGIARLDTSQDARLACERAALLRLPRKVRLKKIILEHAKLAYNTKGKHGIIELRKHLVKYAAGMPGAKKLRERLVRVESVEDIEKIISSLL